MICRNCNIILTTHDKVLDTLFFDYIQLIGEKKNISVFFEESYKINETVMNLYSRTFNKNLLNSCYLNL